MSPCLLPLLPLAALLQLPSTAAVTPLGDQRDLVVDRALIERLDHAELRLQTPHSAHFDVP